MTESKGFSNQSQIDFCEEKQRLIGEFVAASRELTELQAQQTRVVIEGDSDFARFDDLLHVAREKKDRAKYRLIAHVEEHKC